MPFVWFIAAIAILWLWLTGHWFGRVLAFIAVFGFTAFLINGGLPRDTSGFEAFSYIIVELIAAWLIAALPQWYRRRSARISVLL